MLTTTDHSRDAAGLTYIYPVLSRRSGGLSIGINLNPNNACNWRCIYCQVPDLVRGAAPTIDTVKLGEELEQFLHQLADGSFFDQHEVPQSHRIIKDIALSGNGEPTTANEIIEVMQIISKARQQYSLDDKVKTVLISNGSMMHKPHVQTALGELAQINGEVWFKIDSVVAETISRVNNVAISRENILKRLAISSSLCPTWIQTCLFRMQGQNPDDSDITAYLEFIDQIIDQQVSIKGIHLYTLARPSYQAEADVLSAVDEDWLKALQEKLLAKGITATVSA